MAKRATRSQNAEPGDESREAAEAEGAEGSVKNGRGGRAASGTITKAEAIRRALAGGFDSPDDGTDYIRSTFGLEVSKPHFSATKSHLKSKKSSAKGPPARRGRKPRVEGLEAPPQKAATRGESDLIAAMEAMKPLVAALGAEKVKRIADLLG